MKGKAYITIDGGWKLVPVEVVPGAWHVADAEPDLTGYEITGRAQMRVDATAVPGGGEYHVLLVRDPRDDFPWRYAVFWDRPSKLFVKVRLDDA